MPSFSANIVATPLRMAIVVFEGTKLLDVCGPLQVFSDARLQSGVPAYEIDLVSESGGRIATDTVCAIGSTSFGESSPGDWDTVLISGGDAAYQAMQSDALLGFVHQASKSCRRLSSICLGAFILAAGGHLAGRRATTHWDGCARLASDFPDISVEDDTIFIEDKGIWTSAGVTAGIDMALEMVRRDLGPREALRLAKTLVLPVHRSGGQRQFSEALSAQISNVETRFSDLIVTIASDLRRDHSVSALSSRAGMSERNFSRLFSMELGIGPARFVEQLRVEHAASLLHQGNIALAAVQAEAGFTNAEQMRRAFQRCKGVSPSQYAAKFALCDRRG